MTFSYKNLNKAKKSKKKKEITIVYLTELNLMSNYLLTML